jgi:glutamate 5-kinase
MVTMHPFINTRLQSINRIVVKVGTHLLHKKTGGLNLELMTQLVRQISLIRQRNIEVILVSSGAVGAGATIMGIKQPPEDLSQRQALAAIGQSQLIDLYQERFQKYNHNVAQVLLTRDALDDRQRYLNIRNTLETLLNWGIIPIINENDTVAVEELKFGDNDQLSAMIAVKMQADLLVILSDVDGLYDRSPSDEQAERISVVDDIDAAMGNVSELKNSSFSLGGMRSKLEAVRIALQAGILSHINNGRLPDILLHILKGKDTGTWFKYQERKIKGRKLWLAFGKRLGDGKVVIDKGAERALLVGGKSLLPTGVISVSGIFHKKDLIRVHNTEGKEIARGLTQFSSEEITKIKGKQTSEIPDILGSSGNFEVIHRNNLVIIENGGTL